MNLEQLDIDNINKISEIVKENKNWVQVLKNKKFKALTDWLNLKLPVLKDKKYTLKTKVYWILHGFKNFPYCKFYKKQAVCEICPSFRPERNIDDFLSGYTRACSKDCKFMKLSRKSKAEETNLKKYGAKQYFSSDDGRRNKLKWLSENNVENAFQLQSVKDKAKKSLIKKYGCQYASQNLEIKNKIKNNYLNKTGFDHHFKNPNIKEKIKIKKLSSEKNNYLKQKIKNREKRYKIFLSSNLIPCFSLDFFKQLTNEEQYLKKLKWKCKICGCEFESPIDQNFSSRFKNPARCLNCNPINSGKSNMEKEIVDFLYKNISEEKIILNCKSIIPPVELDIYIPDKKLAIEFDGLYWHSERNGKGKKYHLNKTEACEKLGIQLIHIFENEWVLKPEIVKSRLNNLLGVFSNIVFARKCEVKEIGNKETKEFLDMNHIQGSVGSSVNLGLYFKNELISLMTFGKTRFSKKYEYELIRFCNKLNYHVPGAAGKLLKYFERNFKPKSLVSYADRRWSVGKLYKALNFKLEHISSPNYWYFKDDCRLYSRVVFQKHKLSKKLEKYDEKLTEIQNMAANNYNRIFDCGNLVFSKKYNI